MSEDNKIIDNKYSEERLSKRLFLSIFHGLNLSKSVNNNKAVSLILINNKYMPFLGKESELNMAFKIFTHEPCAHEALLRIHEIIIVNDEDAKGGKSQHGVFGERYSDEPAVKGSPADITRKQVDKFTSGDNLPNKEDEANSNAIFDIIFKKD